MVKVYPRRIDLENFEKLKEFEATLVAESLDQLKVFIDRRRNELKA
jgi:hypothetical protein